MPFFRIFINRFLCSFGLLFASLVLPISVGEDRKPEQDRPAEPSTPDAWFGQTIRESLHRKPADELAGFHVPEGFAVELIASEPDIAKPLNMSFDAKGRLWVTQSVQYPFPSSPQEVGRDSIVVLEDKDHDGSFESKTLFADNLNIPIGIVNYLDGVIAFSIPNIWWLRDTDGDGKCDKREVLYGPFDTSRDTHGMINSMRLGEDGWVYACHGYNNISKVSGRDGQGIEMSSGNVFRFRPDGSRIEVFTNGQVNPFGMDHDEFGNWFTADCHSKPLTQLVRGGCYPSFGRPDDGLGFIEPMMEHLHGSTAICGLAYIDHSHFPKSFQGNLVSGNVMTCRINRNRLDYRGTTVKAIEMPDLLTSDDPWFRPVDIVMGPDKAIYVADFYNKVIGHYEVPLDHPDRDRTSGRIWRIRWTGKTETQANSSTQREQTKAVEPNSSLSAKDPMKLKVNVDRMKWQLELPRKDGSAATLKLTALLPTADQLDTSKTDQAMALKSIVELLSIAAKGSELSWLLQSRERIDEAFDPILKQAHLIAIRDVVAREISAGAPFPSDLFSVDSKNPKSIEQTESRMKTLVKVLGAIRDPKAASWALAIIEQAGSILPSQYATPWLRESIINVASQAGDSELDRLLTIVRKMYQTEENYTSQFLVIGELQKQRHGRLQGKMVEMGEEAIESVSNELLRLIEKDSVSVLAKQGSPLRLHSWIGRATGKRERDWPLETRRLSGKTASGEDQLQFWSSFDLDERWVGTWTTSDMIAPKQLSFWIVGHNGLPTEPDPQKNYARILVQQSNGDWTEWARYLPPRSDLGNQVEVDLKDLAGKKIRLQVVDGMATDSYAWVGIAGVSEAGSAWNAYRSVYDKLHRMAACFGNAIAAKEIGSSRLVNWRRVLESPGLDWPMRARLSRWMNNQSLPLLNELIDVAILRGWVDLVESIDVNDWSKVNAEQVQQLTEAICKRSSALDQDDFTVRLSKQRTLFDTLKSLASRGILSKESFRAIPAAWWDTLSAEEAEKFAEFRPSGDQEVSRAAIVQTKAAMVEQSKPDLTLGAKVFADRCAVCHQLAGQGKVIGPQLDGAITRSIERLCEDVFWPSRNVDEAFRVTLVLLDGGETVSGLVIDRQSDTIQIVDQAGVARRIPISEIEKEKVSKVSLMPNNLEEIVTDHEFASLIGFLKSQVPKK